MKHIPALDPEVFTVARFQACTADLRTTIAHLQAIEYEMHEAILQMRCEDHSRELLIVAESVLSDVHSALRELTGPDPRSAGDPSAESCAIAL
jgi:hypothetical protein